jgi:hypothetical protein
VESLKNQYKDRVNVRIYRAGKDFDYIPKYGLITKSMLIINEKKVVRDLTKKNVRAAFEEALKK